MPLFCALASAAVAATGLIVLYLIGMQYSISQIKIVLIIFGGLGFFIGAGELTVRWRKYKDNKNKTWSENKQ